MNMNEIENMNGHNNRNMNVTCASSNGDHVKLAVKSRNRPNDFVSRVLITSLPPAVLCFLYFNDVIPWEMFQILLSICIFFHYIVPILFKYNVTFQRNLIFLNSVNLPRFAQYNRPEYHGLIGTRNFYLKTEDDIHLGVWHVLPDHLIKDNLAKEDEEEYYEKTLSHGPPVFVYLHGNSSNRAAGHHIELHKILRKTFHVITFDYRGYGDSVGTPSEQQVVNDALTILRWVKTLTTAPVLVWGHSLGTAIATHSLRTLTERNDCFVQGLVLESPFDNMRNEIGEHPLSAEVEQTHDLSIQRLTLFHNDFQIPPWFRYAVVDTICKSGFLFASDDHINHVNCPILMLHAEDDWVVPFKLGFRLYNIAAQQRNVTQGPISFERFAKKYGCGHKYICRAPELPNIVKNFVGRCLEK